MEKGETAGLLKTEIAIAALAVALLFLWALPDVKAWVASWRPPTVQARLQCEAPGEYETRLVYVNTGRDGSIRVACGPTVAGSMGGSRSASDGARGR